MAGQVQDQVEAYSDTHYRALLDAVDDGFCVVQMLFDEHKRPVDYRFVEMNATFERQTGLQQALGKTARELVPDLEAHWFEIYGKVALTGEPIRFENGSAPMRRWFDVSALPFGPPEHHQVAILFKDITARKAQEEALRQSEERLRLAVAATGLGIFDWDLVTDQVTVNARFRELLGLPPGDEVIGQAMLGGVVHPDDREMVNAHITAACGPDSEGKYAFEHRAITAKGEIWLVTFGQVYFAGAGADRRAVRIIGNDLDITERKRAEEALRASEQHLRRLSQSLEERVMERTAELEAINRELDQFTYVASHDLKAPLRAIHQLAAWIVEDSGGSLPTTAQAHLMKLQMRIQRMETLLNDLLVYSRAGRQRYAQEEIDTGALVHHIVEMLAPPPGFVVEVVTEMPRLWGERIALETVLRNLIANAIKHHNCPTAGRVVVSAQPQGEFVEFMVRDNGPGIDPAFHVRIFEMFQTLRPRDAVEGSGIGLALVKRYVESRGGTIAVESSRGAGATFRFTWPRIHTQNG